MYENDELENLMKEYGIEVELVEHFSVIRETLDRIGIANKEKKILNPSCYLLHKRGAYTISHFKQLLALDGKKTNFSEEDFKRAVSIARLLEDWGLITIIDPERYDEVEDTFVFVLPYKQKSDWEIKHKYSIGFKK
jgi:hypothetical protein